MASQYKYNRILLACMAVAIIGSSCKKLIEIDPPTSTISTSQVFETEAQATGAIAGIYTRMIHGDQQTSVSTAAGNLFSAGLTTSLAGLSAGELKNFRGTQALDYELFSTNKLTAQNTALPSMIWNSAFTNIYGANAVIEGIAASTSGKFPQAARNQLTGEARFIRAFCYFYLVNFFGELPLALTINFNQTVNLPKSGVTKVYEQIVTDLEEAEQLLAPDYQISANERVRPNRYAATALLARVHLYNKRYEQAALKAQEVIDQTQLYRIEPSLLSVFGTGSGEAIWQLKQNTASMIGTATPEGYFFLPNPLNTGTAALYLSELTLSKFETGDLRRTQWIGYTDNSLSGGPITPEWYPAKYKTGISNSIPNGMPSEYYMMLRLAEMYLIRAEARANGAPGGLPEAIRDLNIIRDRAGIDWLPNTLNKEEVLAAIAKERETELFAEWGHRWFDLKRTGAALEVLKSMSNKLPWDGDHQLLYPIPVNEIRNSGGLIQNPGY